MNRDHRRHRDVVTAALIAALVLAGLPAAASAQGPGGDEALVTVYSGGVDFLPMRAYSKAILTVTGNDETHRYELDSGRDISIGLFDPAGELRGDGLYKWELSFVPTKAEARRLQAEAAENGGRPLAERSPQGGWFTIRDGFIADPELIEAGAARTAARSGSGGSLPAPSDFGARPVPAADSDGQAGSAAWEAAMADPRPTSTTSGDGITKPGRAAADSDAANALLGASATAAAPRNDNQITARPARPRSDGSNGRPRSER